LEQQWNGVPSFFPPQFWNNGQGMTIELDLRGQNEPSGIVGFELCNVPTHRSLQLLGVSGLGASLGTNHTLHRVRPAMRGIEHLAVKNDLVPDKPGQCNQDGQYQNGCGPHDNQSFGMIPKYRQHGEKRKSGCVEADQRLQAGDHADSDGSTQVGLFILADDKEEKLRGEESTQAFGQHLRRGKSQRGQKETDGKCSVSCLRTEKAKRHPRADTRR
jgi:hypothetical protein